MFLKRLTMKGFKSFAEATTLEFEPGVTAVVGPNGSGKSNVVDAVTWVLGAQSTRALRSAKMEDVIFVGTATRPALGRAEVTLTLDNASGRLPVDGAEVTISRTLFRNGDSEYAINGAVCRLLDVQELLSDSGVGRQQHMIIGQGQLDAVLNSRPEDRRSVIEEAAGVLKHRRRKERAERRLDATHENLERLGDLVREVRRQMRPLERQAVAARSYADIESELRATQRYVFATRLDEHLARRRVLDDQLHQSAIREQEFRQSMRTLDARAAAAAIEISGQREESLASTLGRLHGLSERARGTTSLIAERRRGARAALIAAADENVIATLEADAAHLASERSAVDEDERGLAGPRDDAATARVALAEAEAQFEATWGETAVASAQIELRESTERLDVLTRTHDAAHSTLVRTQERLVDLVTRLDQARDTHASLVRSREEWDRTAVDRRRELDGATADAGAAARRRASAEDALRQRREDAVRARARADAVTHAFEELSGASARALLDDHEGVVGALLELIDIEPGAERAVESAIGVAASATVVAGESAIRHALATLRREGGAGAVLPAATRAVTAVTAPERCVALRSVVRARSDAPSHVNDLLDAVCASAVLADSFDTAIDVAFGHPELVVVTREGDRLAPTGWRAASGRSIITRAAVDEAQRMARDAEEVVPAATATLDTADVAVAAADERVRTVTELTNVATQALSLVTADLAHATDAVAQLEGALAACRDDELTWRTTVERAERERTELETRRATLATTVTEAEQRARWAQEARATLDAHRDQVSARDIELVTRNAEIAERRRLIEQRASEVEERLSGRGDERQVASERRERLEFEAAALARLGDLVAGVAERVAHVQDALNESYREQREASRTGAELLETLRRERAGREAEITALSDGTRADEIERAELAIKITGLHDAIRRELGEAPEDIFGASAPPLPEGVSVEVHLAQLEARIGSLGPINPLALEELTALEVRYKELDTQVSDVRHARRELLEVLRTLDEEIMTTFSVAVADVNEHFSTLISMLFPGGQGRLILTAPDDPLNTGVEIEVRPLGRNVRRISLLSGGERSMAALAFLFAVFRSRPSPFYMMDEVEAALDDVNLQRFLSLVDEFRDEAQLLIVTHQKRTMEAADALYGVTMAPGGSSKVVSQRVRRDEPVPA